MQFGIASCDITPPFRTSMGGYALRSDHFKEVHDSLTFSALVLEEGSRRALIAAADIIAWPNGVWTLNLMDRLARLLGTEPSQIILNASHTHGGPKIPNDDFISIASGDRSASDRYLDWLARQVMQTVDAAASRLRPGSLHLARGKTALPMNRRLLVNGEIINAPNPQGPVDDGMQTLVVRDAAGTIAAIVSRISCHPVATGSQLLITSDFVGAWRDAIRRRLGAQVQPIFLQGAAGDMRPRCAADGAQWRKLDHAELGAVGDALAAETLDALEAGPLEPMDHLILEGHLETCAAPCEPRYTNPASVEPLLRHPRCYEREFARACLRLFSRNQVLPTSVEFRVQTLWLSNEVALVGLNCEPLHRLGLAIEQAFAPNRAIVLGYTGGCVGYAPDTDALRRGGYEAETYLFEPWSGPWRQGFEATFRPHLLTRPPISPRASQAF